MWEQPSPLSALGSGSDPAQTPLPSSAQVDVIKISETVYPPPCISPWCKAPRRRLDFCACRDVFCFLMLTYSKSYFPSQSRTTLVQKPLLVVFFLHTEQATKIQYILCLFSFRRDLSSLLNTKAHIFYASRVFVVWFDRLKSFKNCLNFFGLSAICLLIGAIPRFCFLNRWFSSHYDLPHIKFGCWCLMHCCIHVWRCSLQKWQLSSWRYTNDHFPPSEPRTQRREEQVSVGLVLILSRTSLWFTDGFSSWAFMGLQMRLTGQPEIRSQLQVRATTLESMRSEVWAGFCRGRSILQEVRQTDRERKTERQREREAILDCSQE